MEALSRASPSNGNWIIKKSKNMKIYPNRRKSFWSKLRLSMRMLFTCLILAFFALIIIAGTALYYNHLAAQYSLNEVRVPSSGNILLDSQDKVINTESEGKLKEEAKWEEFPAHLIDALIAREDENFFSHEGVVYKSILRSALVNLRDMRFSQGASTITMQLARNVFNLRAKTINRKLLEVCIARRIEDRFNKKIILTQYLNRIYFGESCYGIAYACSYYFNKKVSALNLVESACLVGLIRGPSIFNPIANMERSMNAKKETLMRMLKLEMISDEEFQKACDAPIILNKASRKRDISSYPSIQTNKEIAAMRLNGEIPYSGLIMSSYINIDIQHLVERSSEDIIRVIEGSCDMPKDVMPYLNLDPAVQKKITHNLRKAKRPKNLPQIGFNPSHELLQCAVLVLDSRVNAKGQILAITQGRSASDAIHRWDLDMYPGYALAPVLYCAIAQPGSEHYIIAHDPLLSATRVGYEPIAAYFQSLNCINKIPKLDQAKDLYEGKFPIQRLQLAKLHYAILHQGRNFELRSINTFFDIQNKLLYKDNLEKPKEIIFRESSHSILSLPPFKVNNKGIISLSTALPDGHGYWSMVSNRRGVTVFVWLGFDDSTSSFAQNKVVRALIARLTPVLSRKIHTETRIILQTQRNLKKKLKNAK